MGDAWNRFAGIDPSDPQTGNAPAQAAAAASRAPRNDTTSHRVRDLALTVEYAPGTNDIVGYQLALGGSKQGAGFSAGGTSTSAIGGYTVTVAGNRLTVSQGGYRDVALSAASR